MFGIYIHIPFCLSKCSYCDFHSVAIRPEEVPGEAYAKAVCAEAEHLAKKYGLRGREVGSVYFGGGTPTTLKPRNFETILTCLREIFLVSSSAEITIESNPETLNSLSPHGRGLGRGGVSGLLKIGFNRLSFGIQSFNDTHLQTLGRIHSAQIARRAVKQAQDAGFKNINIDIIWGLPGQTILELEQDLNEAIAMDVQHISAYQLTLDAKSGVAAAFLLSPPSSSACPPPPEADAPLAQAVWRGGRPPENCGILKDAATLPDGDLKVAATLPDEELSRQMWLLVRDKLTFSGYEHYEISNFSRKGDSPPSERGLSPFSKGGMQVLPPFFKGGLGGLYRCFHNLNYWRYGEWLGLGSGATSFIACHCESAAGGRSNPVRCVIASPKGEAIQSVHGIASASPRNDNTLIRFTSSKNISNYLLRNFTYETEPILAKTAMAEYCFMALRTSDGIDLNDFARRFGKEFDLVYPNLRQEWALRGFAIEPSHHLAILPESWLISDELFQELI